MDTILLVLGILGIGAIIIAAYVFTVAARNYVSENDSAGNTGTATSSRKIFIERSQRERRQTTLAEFPMTVDGILIPQDRRVVPERRLSTA